MPELISCDLAIVGAGSAGLSVAAVAAQLKLKVVLIEADEMGGDCLNTGCVPSKSFLAAAKAAHTMQTAEPFGITAVTPQIDFEKVLAYVHRVITKLAPHDSVERFTALGVQVIKGRASFVDATTLAVDATHIKARRFIIATGSSPAIPPIPGIKDIPYLTNETIFSLKTKPSHLVIIGGGPIGCELAQGFLFLGIKVTLLEAFTIMPRDEMELVTLLKEILVRQGLSLYETAKITHVSKDANGIRINFEHANHHQTITASHVLVAAGRQANVSGLNLEKAQVNFSPKGICVDASLRTANKRIYALGDVIGSFQFTHIANYHAGIIIRNVIFKLSAKVNYTSIPWVTFTSPELAHAGKTAAEALSQDPQAQIILLDLAGNDRAQTENQTQGKIKVVLNRKNKILGVSILAPLAGELILPWVMLIQEGKSLKSFTEVIVPYPTYSELSKQVASQHYAKRLYAHSVQRIVNFLKYF